jgi:hypothetical protein
VDDALASYGSARVMRAVWLVASVMVYSSPDLLMLCGAPLRGDEVGGIRERAVLDTWFFIGLSENPAAVMLTSKRWWTGESTAGS